MPEKHNDVSLHVLDEQDISNRLDKSIRDLLVVCFPGDRDYYQRQSWWHSPAVFRVIAQNAQDSIVAHTAVTDREIIVGRSSSKVRAAGVQSFCLSEEYRGTGLSREMMSAAMKQAGEREFDCGLLFCRRPLEKVYGGMGFERIDAPVYMADQSKGRTLIPAGNIAMFYPLKAKSFPVGDIELNGPDW
jgi:GNAT superfamily N-acetyltransferase